MMKSLVGIMWIVLVLISGTSGNPDAKRLYDDLLSNYNKLVRPVVNVTDALTVKIKLKLSQLIDVSPEEEDKSGLVAGKTAPGGHGSTKGITSSFGFKKKSTLSNALVSSNPNAAKRLANSTDDNGNNDDKLPLTSNAVPTSRSTAPRIPAPKKEPQALRGVSRFGFRQPPANRHNKVADITADPPVLYMDSTGVGSTTNNNTSANNAAAACRLPAAAQIQAASHPPASAAVMDSNRNNKGKFLLQCTQLPKPVSVRIMETNTKAAKTLANNNKKIYMTTTQQHQMQAPSSDESSKDGSAYLTEDSGIGHSGHYFNQLSVTTPQKPKDGSSVVSRTRHLDVVVSGNKFDVREYDGTSGEEGASATTPLPRLPSAFGNTNAGFVRDRTIEYQRNVIDRDKRKVSVASSEASTCSEDGGGASDDVGAKALLINRQRFLKSAASMTPPKSFLKSKATPSNSSPPTSDDQMWSNAGEAMAVDEFSCSFSSSDESREQVLLDRRLPRKGPSVSAALQNLMTAAKTHSLHKCDVKQVLLAVDDPDFAAVASEAQDAGAELLIDEPSPDNSLIHSPSENEDLTTATEVIRTCCIDDKHATTSSSIEEKQSNSSNEKHQLVFSSPGTPTNASNSFSLSDGRDFLIDDEIADQPGLLGDDTITNTSEATATSGATTAVADKTLMMDGTPKPRKKMVPEAWSQSPSVARRRSNRLRSRTGSLDTLSPCESIASDDFMMDYDQSMSSGIDDIQDRSDRHSGAFVYDDADASNNALLSVDFSKTDVIRDWSCLLATTGSVKSGSTSLPLTPKLARRRGTTTSSTSGYSSPRNNQSALSSLVTGRSNLASASPLSLTHSHRPIGDDNRTHFLLSQAANNSVKSASTVGVSNRCFVNQKQAIHATRVLRREHYSTSGRCRDNVPSQSPGDGWCSGVSSSVSAKSLTNRPSRLLRSRGSTPPTTSTMTVADPIRSSTDGTLNHLHRTHESSTSSSPLIRPPRILSGSGSVPSPLRLSSNGLANGATTRSSNSSTAGYDSDESGPMHPHQTRRSSSRLDRSLHNALIQDTMSMKTMLFRLKRVLQEQLGEDILLRSDTHNPFDAPTNSAKNGLFVNGLGGSLVANASQLQQRHQGLDTDLEQQEADRVELNELRRQVLFLQGQLEDRDREVQRLHHDIAHLAMGIDATQSAPVSSDSNDVEKSNAATQTDRIRPISCGPALLENTSNNGSLVSANEINGRSKNHANDHHPPTRRPPHPHPNHVTLTPLSSRAPTLLPRTTPPNTTSHRLSLSSASSTSPKGSPGSIGGPVSGIPTTTNSVSAKRRSGSRPRPAATAAT